MTARTELGTTRQDAASALLVGVATVIAYLALALGLFVAFQAVSGGLTAEVPVRLTADAPAYSDVVLPCVDGWTLDGDSCEPAATPEQWRGGVALPVTHTGDLLTSTWNPGALTALMATAPAWGGPIAGGLVGLVLIPTLRDTASGRPFLRGHARRLATAAGLVVLGWLLLTAGPFLAGPAVIEAIESPSSASASSGLALPHGWLAPDLRVTWWPLLIAGLLGALAAATHQGARLAVDTEGLV